jgi:hypothetical protein
MMMVREGKTNKGCWQLDRDNILALLLIKKRSILALWMMTINLDDVLVIVIDQPYLSEQIGSNQRL